MEIRATTLELSFKLAVCIFYLSKRILYLIDLNDMSSRHFDKDSTHNDLNMSLNKLKMYSDRNDYVNGSGVDQDPVFARI